MVNLLARQFLRFSLGAVILLVLLLIPACTQMDITPAPQPNPITKPSEPETSEPETSEPETSEPETSEPKTNEPETSDPKTNEPETPKTNEPKPITIPSDLKLPPAPNYEEIVVLKCTACKTDVLTVLDLESFKLVSSKMSLPKSGGVPAWITEVGSIPFSEKPTCDSMNKLYVQTLYAGNYYRSYYRNLEKGASYVEFDGKTNSIYAPKSSQHSQAKDFLYKALNLSFANTENILKPMQKAGCLKSSGQ